MMTMALYVYWDKVLIMYDKKPIPKNVRLFEKGLGLLAVAVWPLWFPLSWLVRKVFP